MSAPFSGDSRRGLAIVATDDARAGVVSSPQALKLACRIRALEYKLLDLFKEGKLFGTVHTYIGQEFCASSFAGILDSTRDAVFATHRGHGWYLASDGPLDGFMAELMGREGGLCDGRGGSQHLHHGNFFSSGIQGGTALLATGWAWAQKAQGSQAIAIAQIGDGTLGEGAVYEALTFAALFKIPVLFVLEWNGCAQSTETRSTTPGDLIKRIEGFGVAVDRRSDADPAELQEHLSRVVELVRTGQPFFQIIDTRRLMPHSKGDDHRPKAALDKLWASDPLTSLLESEGDARGLFEQAQVEMETAAAAVSARPLAEPGCGRAWPDDNRAIWSEDLWAQPPHGTSAAAPRMVEELNRALHAAMAANSKVMLLGEDVVDPYGGAFKASKGLSTAFPEQVFSTPIAEAAISGIANGLALGGMRPVTEIMFADFVTLAADQIINHAAKVHYMYGNTITCPVIVRMPSGGRRGYGPTHSQSTESLFFGVPGLRIVACSKRHAVGQVLGQLLTHEKSPTLLIENKLLYATEIATKPPLDLEPVSFCRKNGDYPPIGYRPRGGNQADVTLVTYGGMVDPCEDAMKQLILDDELRFDFLVLTQLWPLTDEEIVASVRKTGRLVVAEEGVSDFGVGAALIASVAQKLQQPFRARSVGMKPVPIPCARHLEDQVLPSAADVVAAVKAVAQ
jgi:2-oxoisovalerate dehydrogenase E1 component